MNIFFYLGLGLLPSLIWLSFYLRKDKNPEPNSAVIRFFILGVLISIPAIILEIALISIVDPGFRNSLILGISSWLNYSPDFFLFIPETDFPQNHLFLKTILISALIPGLVEEYLKYSRTRFHILKNPEFDEPIDVMIYCIIVALGFAAIENLLILFGLPIGSTWGEAIHIMILRFPGATLLHAMASAIAGYFLALGLLNYKKRKRLIFWGLTIAILCHSCYNFLIGQISLSQGANQAAFIVLLVSLLIIMSVFVSNCFRKLKKLNSVCKID